MSTGVEAFAEQLATLKLSQAELAVALLWYLEVGSPGTFCTARELAKIMLGLGLANPNVTRLSGQLRKHAHTIAGPQKGTFKLSLSAKSDLRQRYGSFLTSQEIPAGKDADNNDSQRVLTSSKDTKPKVFIGSSVEGLAIAEHVQSGLEYVAECTLWSQGVFELSRGNLENLVEMSRKVDFAILVLTPDDLTLKRGNEALSPRDNVLFELGLFMGALGREKTVMVYCRDDKMDLPTDLLGISAATYGKRSDGNLQAALGSACTALKTALKKL